MPRSDLTEEPSIRERIAPTGGAVAFRNENGLAGELHCASLVQIAGAAG